MDIFKIDTVIDSLDNIKQAEAPSFFETRLKAKMEQQLIQQGSAWFNVKRPVYIITSLIIFSCLNLYLINNKSSKKDSNTYSGTQSSTLESFTKDYQLINNATY